MFKKDNPNRNIYIAICVVIIGSVFYYFNSAEYSYTIYRCAKGYITTYVPWGGKTGSINRGEFETAECDDSLPYGGGGGYGNDRRSWTFFGVHVRATFKGTGKIFIVLKKNGALCAEKIIVGLGEQEVEGKASCY
jgi:hypothetical protein